MKVTFLCLIVLCCSVISASANSDADTTIEEVNLRALPDFVGTVDIKQVLEWILNRKLPNHPSFDRINAELVDNENPALFDYNQFTALNVAPLTVTETVVLDNYATTFNLTFTTLRERRVAVVNVIEATTFIENNNYYFEIKERPVELELFGFNHLPEDDFVKKYLGLLPLPPKDFDRRRAALSPAQCGNIPETLNWNEKGKVPKVKTQMECGSCYIFSSTAAIESAIAIEYGIEPITMSRQHLLNCVKEPKMEEPNGCNAGRPEWVWMLARDEGGLVAESSPSEYTGVQGTCNKDAPKAFYSEVESWERIPNKGSPEEVEEQIRCRLATSGPFHIGMTVRKNDMGAFKSGVYKNSDGICKEGEDVNHGLLLVGYGEKLLEGDSIPTKYWIIQNSWGERWGEQGFMNVERGKNVCNFAADAYFPVLKKTLNPIDKPSVCKESQDIFGAGKYVKSLCLIDENTTYENAQRFCLKNGMRLFRADSNEAKENLLSFANKEWAEKDDFTPFIDGITGNSCKSIAKDGEAFEEDDETDCADRSPSICEFNNKSPQEKQ